MAGIFIESCVNQRILSRYYEGASMAQIARETGLSFAAVRSRIYEMRRNGYLDARRKSLNGVRRPKPLVSDERTAWDRLYAELVEQHRREFLASRQQEPWQCRDGRVYPEPA